MRWWPQGEELKKIQEGFNALRGPNSFPDVVGCIDGMHVSFTASKDEKRAHFNRKCYTSVILQAVCDHTFRFTDLFAGWPGSSNDARVFRNSRLSEKLETPGFIPSHCHILGDCAYPLSSVLLTPYRDNGHLTRSQNNYNIMLSSKRVVIEQAFGQLVGRFRRLKHLYIRKREFVPVVITASCMLHNLCIAHADDSPDVEGDISLLRTEQNGNGDVTG